jgi:GNAT superfamily N-acetyltransferase
MAASDTDVVRRLWGARFGGDSATQENWIEAALTPSHTARGLVAVAPATDAVVGFSFLEVGSPPYTRRYLSLDALDLDPPLAARNGLFHLSCVHPEWEGRGVGSAFYERRLALLAEEDVPRAFGIAWHRPHTVDSRVLFEKHGFTCLATVERYYDRFEERPHCPDCDGPCTCTASLYTRALETA